MRLTGILVVARHMVTRVSKIGDVNLPIYRAHLHKCAKQLPDGIY